MIIVLLFLLNITSLNAAPTIKDAADFSVSLVSELFEQPLNQAETCRLLVVTSRHDALIARFLHMMAAENFGADYEICFSDRNISNRSSCCLECHSANDDKEISAIAAPSSEKLEQQYLSILKVVRGAWRKSLKDSHEGLLSLDHNENEWDLYVKPNFVLHQHSLINALAQKYVPEMKKDIKYYQVGPSVMNCSLSTDEKQLYLWIKKDCSEMVQSFFKFRIDD